MKQLSPVVRKIIAVYLGLLLLALLFVPGYGNSKTTAVNPWQSIRAATYSGYVFLPKVFFSDYYVDYEALTLEIVVLTIGAAFALAVGSLLRKRDSTPDRHSPTG